MDVLVVDDDPDVRSIVTQVLAREGLHTREAATRAEALVQAAGVPVEVIVLDRHLPDADGLDLIGELRAIHADVHIILLTGAASEVDRVRGLTSGADDYVVKPFSPRELAARVLAVERRLRAAAAGTPAGDPCDPLRLGDLVIDRAARSVRRRGRSIDLTPRELELLVHLASHPGQVFSREELLHAVWTSSATWQQVATVTEHVRRIRAKLELDPDNPRMLVTVRGSGYRFDVPEVDAAGPSVDTRVLDAVDATAVIVGSTIRYATPAMLRLLAATDETEVVGHDAFEFVTPESMLAARARQEAASEGRWPRPELITITRLDGSEQLVEIASAPVLWRGEPASQVTLWDHAADTHRVQQLATGLATDVSDAVIVTTEDLRIQSFNAAAEELYGWREDEVIGRSLAETIGWEAAGDASDRWRGEAVQRRRDGTEVRVRSSRTVLRDSAGGTIGVISVNRPTGRATVEWTAVDTQDLALEAAIRAGLSGGEFLVHYQPVVRLATGAVVSVEALVRWQHPSRGLLAPSAFIGVAERSGAIDALGEHVLRSGCEQLATWRGAGHDLDLSVNLSARQLSDPSLVGRVAAAMSGTGTPAGDLWLEVTETSLVEDLDQASRVLHELADLGARISIDDFGTGWASLAYLREFPVHALKIDRVFVAGLESEPRDRTIVASMVSLGSELDVAVIAEGVETEAQRRILCELGCAVGQGYLFGHPAPAEALVLSA